MSVSQHVEKRPINVDRWSVFSICAFLIFAVWLVFGQTVRFDFVNYDDNANIYETPQITGGISWQGIVWAFTHAQVGRWSPLTSISRQIDCQFFGLWAGGHHLTNVLLHTLAELLLFFVLKDLTGSIWRSGFVAAVFGLHPIHVEVVAWVSARGELLGGFFFMLTLWAYIRYARHPFSFGRYLSMVVLYALGLMSKPSLVTVPFLLLVLDYWPLRRYPSQMGVCDACNAKGSIQWLVLEKVPLTILSAISCISTLITQRDTLQPLEAGPTFVRLANALVSYFTYIKEMFYPVSLAANYPRLQNGPPGLEVVLAVVILLLVTAVAIKARKTRPWLIVGWLWYLGMLVPMIGVVQAGELAHADRYTYLPQIGLYIMVAWSMAEICESCKCWKRLVVYGAAAATIFLSIVCARHQVRYWRDSNSLWTRVLACNSQNAMAQCIYGSMLLQAGQVDDALVHYKLAVNCSPDYADAHAGYAMALAQKKQYAAAILQDGIALSINPAHPMAENNMGTSLYKEGRLDEAATHLQNAIKDDPGNAIAYNDLGAVLMAQGRIDRAMHQFEKALELRPDFPLARNNLVNALLKTGEADSAIEQLRKALDFRPHDADINYKVGSLLQSRGRFREAVSYYEKSLAVAPENPRCLNDFAWILATCPDSSLRNGSKAVDLARKADYLAGNQEPLVVDTLAAAYAETGDFANAIAAANRALQVATGQGKIASCDQIRAHLALFRTGKPVREPGASPILPYQHCPVNSSPWVVVSGLDTDV